MEMRRCSIPSILLMLSLGAALLVAGHPSVADDVGTILLPSQDKGTVIHATRVDWFLFSLVQFKLIAAWLVEDLQTKWSWRCPGRGSAAT
jgi:hypothetical protein